MRLWGVLLKRTTLLRIGLASLLLIGLVGLDDRPSYGWALLGLDCLAASVAEDVDVLKALVRRLVRGGEGGRCRLFGPSSLSSALVNALSFMGTGISSSELSSWYCFARVLVIGGATEDWLSLRVKAWREGGRLRAWRCEVLRTRPLAMGVGDTVAMF